MIDAKLRWYRDVQRWSIDSTISEVESDRFVGVGDWGRSLWSSIYIYNDSSEEFCGVGLNNFAYGALDFK